MRLSQAVPSVEAPEAVVSAALPEPAGKPSRVRYWRTPDRLLKQVWGEQQAQAPNEVAAIETGFDPGDFYEYALDDEFAEETAEEVAVPPLAAADEPSTPYAFISDHAFWELGPETAEGGLDLSSEPIFRNEPEEPEGELFEPEMPFEAPVSESRPVGRSDAAAVRPSSLSWSQSYSVNLRFSAQPWVVDRQEATPAEAPRPVAPPAVASMPTPEPGVLITRRSRPEPAAEPPRARRRPVELAPPVRASDVFELPPISFLAEPKAQPEMAVSTETLQQNAGLLEGVLEDFNVRGEIVQACPGPVVTLYELEPAPGTKSSRVISLADDIARSMSAISARVAVIPGKNAIGIELPNAKRETVFLRELLASQDFESTKHKLALCLGKTIGGEPVIADLARMPHLLVAGTTGSGKSVAINTMILSILYRLKPEECRLIMVDPKMLELSVYDGIPHLLTPVVTDPKKAVVALKWAVREMEERYKKMSKLGVRNIDGFNVRVGEAVAAGEVITRTVQTGFDKHSGEAVYEEEVMDLAPLPYIVVIVDEMADLMMVAGKEIEGTIQRLAQMARAAGIHVVLATQRPSVDVITGTIKANFPTRISFQVTSKIDSRTILGEMGAEQLLGQGDMLYMAGGGRITRVHGPFVSDAEVEKVVAHLKTQGRPDYLEAVTAEEEAAAAEDEDGGAIFDKGAMASAESEDPYEQAVAVVLRDKKASTSYIQRRLQIGYNRAASIMERMEHEGIVGPANHAGKREILVETGRAREDED
nr:DNA translocase FtsK [Bosea caraganae]